MLDETARINDDECIHCGRCHDVCPNEAVRHDGERIPEEIEANLEWTRRLLKHFATREEKGELIDYAGREFTLIVWPPDEDDRYPDSAKSKFRNFLEESSIPWDDEGYDPDDFVDAEAIVTLAPQKNNPDMMDTKRYDAI